MSDYRTLDQLLYGADYNPEQWLKNPEILDKDIELMKQAHISVVSLGIFSWSMLEVQEGVYDFSWLKERIDTLYENGISVFLATPSGAKPKWMTDKYPEILRVDEYGRRHRYGERHNHCYTSPVYREKTAQINKKLSECFGKHPGVIGWHISNEYEGACHCPLCQDAFRVWLKKRYGSIEVLNDAWATTFWSHRYDSFDQIESPSPIGESRLHGLNLDWKRFVTDATADFMEAEIEALREAGSTLPVTTNFMYDFDGLNYARLAKSLDFISWDSYPGWFEKPDVDVAYDTAMQHDWMRSMKHEPFYLMESCPSATNWQRVSKLKTPGLLHAASMLAVAQGADGVSYFQFRQSRGSSEKFHGAVVDHYGGADTRVFQEVSGIGADLKKLSGLKGSTVPAVAAIVYDRENRWAMEDSQGPRNEGLGYKETVLKAYHAFRRYGINVDLIDQEQDFSDYRVIAVPMLYLFKKGFTEKLRSFTDRGGVVLLTFWSGVADETDLCFTGETPHDLTDMFGVCRTEIDALYPGMIRTGIPVAGNSLDLYRTYRCENLCELPKAKEGTEVLMTYGEDFYEGYPVLTARKYGRGMAYYIAADFEQEFYDDLIRRVLIRKQIPNILYGVTLQEGLLVSSREDMDYDYIFIQNYTGKTQKLRLDEELELILGERADEIRPYETLIFTREKLLVY